MVSVVRVKLLSSLFLFVLLSLSVFFVFAEDADALTCFNSDKDVCIVPNCEEEFSSLGLDAGKCSFDVDFSNIVLFSKSAIVDSDGLLMPLGIDNNVFSLKTKEISCANPLSLKLAWFDYKQGDWTAIPESFAFYVDKNGNPSNDVTDYVMLTLESEGYFHDKIGDLDKIYVAVIEARHPYTERDECIKTGCPRGKSIYVTDDYGLENDGKLAVGGKITFNYCPTVKGCKPDADGVCDKKCPQDIDPDCGRCTPDKNDCCDLSADKFCDEDCGDADPDCSCSKEKDDCCSGIEGDVDCLPKAEEDLVVDFDEEIGVMNYIKSYVYWSDEEGGVDETQYYQGIKQTSIASCNYNIDGVCDVRCPKYKIAIRESSESGDDIKIITRYVDADCCELKRTSLDTKGVPHTLEGLAVADYTADGCCKATCDGFCDPDCLLGQDPDCSIERGINSDLVKSLEEWASDVRGENSDVDSSNFFSGDSTTQCSGCGNGVCEFNVWGGGRFDRPFIGQFDVEKGNFNNIMGLWQTLPSFVDIVKFNWNYVNDVLQTNEIIDSPITRYPIFFSMMYINKHYNGLAPNPLPADACFKNNKIWNIGRLRADCGVYAYYDEGIYKIASFLKGNQKEQDGVDDLEYHDGVSIYQEGSFKNIVTEEIGISQKDKLDFGPWKTFYPFDENPDNCPLDCWDDYCGDDICQPWEAESGSCYLDCNVNSKSVAPLSAWIDQYSELRNDKEGYLIFKERFKLSSGGIMNPGSIVESLNKDEIGLELAEGFRGSESELAVQITNHLHDSKPLCAFAYPGEQGNCPAGSVCGYYGECLSQFDFVKLAEEIEDFEFEGKDFYQNLANFVDKDLDTYVESEDCNDFNTFMNPDAFDECDGVDNNCDGVVDNLPDAEEGTACDKAFWVCKEPEPNFKITKTITEETVDEETLEITTTQVEKSVVGCILSYCSHEKGSDVGRIGNILQCSYEVSAEEEYGQKAYYTYVCDPDNPEDDCGITFQSTFEICKEKEDICNDNVDNDCDGSIDKNDPDCFNCNPDESALDRCRLIEKEWCSLANGEPTLTTDGYCDANACGLLDASCSEGVQACGEGEIACGRGCRPVACDIFDNLTCNENGVWLATNYETNCAAKDAGYSTTCENNACDYVMDSTCLGSEWRPSGDYCGNPLACGGRYDSECNGVCEVGACDTKNNKYCTNAKSWSSTDYCDYCGYTDSDCGVQACQEGACDYSSFKYCNEGIWKETSSTDEYCTQCFEFPIDPEFVCHEKPCEKTAETESNCGNFIDDDCDGLIDCEDTEDCDVTSPVCVNPPCLYGTKRTCGNNIGLCEVGEQECNTNGEWGSCTGGVQPKSEVCNSFDDDCDDGVDEGCGDCLGGEIKECGYNIGSCSAGIQICNKDTGLWSKCFGGNYASSALAEEICDGYDNDCDGDVDEGCSCEEGLKQECGSDVGVCERGTQTCSNSLWGACVGGQNELPEICGDSLDNDCDGLIDNLDPSCDPNLVSKSSLPTCYDAILNQEEEQVDCGGPCSSCSKVTCNDRKQNADETGLDCGGADCPPCKGEKVEIVAYKSECGDSICEDDEDEVVCPDDCLYEEESKGIGFTSIVIMILIFGVLALGGFVVYKNVKAGRQLLDMAPLKNMFVKNGVGVKTQSKMFTSKNSQVSRPMAQQPTSGFKKKKVLSREEKELQKSFKKTEELFK
ncbi:hypothetical protein COV16_00410 [Candidatus Woesearchaeota archaeon CG10_big_fil_rev_8_21_14_0_10_34_8]|nr:MAG: hypothetical protein COV16_00410 [Candidatus Woesearchaeota archaeon CG10_big_fil_rev_8_21_14_0_10_34_8]